MLFLQERETSLQAKGNQTTKIRVDYKLVLMSIVGLLTFTTFSIFESVTPLAFYEEVKNMEQVFSLLLVINSILALIIQPLIIKVSQGKTFFFSIVIGSCFFSMAYCLFGLGKHTIFMLIFATLIFTVGESFLIPSLDVLVDELSTETNKSLYFSISEIKQLGFFIGPALSGIILECEGILANYLLFALLPIFVIIFAKILKDKTATEKMIK